MSRLLGADFPKDRWVTDLLRKINEIFDRVRKAEKDISNIPAPPVVPAMDEIKTEVYADLPIADITTGIGAASAAVTLGLVSNAGQTFGGAKVFTDGLRCPAAAPSHAVDGPSGRGSTNTFTVIYSNVRENAGGTDIAYNNSGTNGDSWTILTSGLYAFTASLASTSGSMELGIFKNTVANPTSTDWSKILAYVTGPVSTILSCSGVAPLAAGDVVRVNANVTSINTAIRTGFRIAKIL